MNIIMIIITKLINIPIVIHGSTGVKDEDLQKLTKYNVGKINIGTALRMAFTNTLREEMIKKIGVEDESDDI